MRGKQLLTGGICTICGYDGSVLLSWSDPRCEQCDDWAKEFNDMPQPIPAVIGRRPR